MWRLASIAIACVQLSAAPVIAAEPMVVKGSAGWVGSIAFSPDGSSLASASSDGAVRVWDAATGNAKAVLKGHADIVAAVAFAPSGAPPSAPVRLASASFDGTVKLWNVATGSETRTLRGHRG